MKNKECSICHKKSAKRWFVGEICGRCHKFKMLKPKLKRFLKWYTSLSLRQSDELKAVLRHVIDTEVKEYDYSSFQDILEKYYTYTEAHIGLKHDFFFQVILDEDETEYRIIEQACQMRETRTLLLILDIMKETTSNVKYILNVAKMIIL